MNNDNAGNYELEAVVSESIKESKIFNFETEDVNVYSSMKSKIEEQFPNLRSIVNLPNIPHISLNMYRIQQTRDRRHVLPLSLSLYINYPYSKELASYIREIFNSYQRS
ncbi:hypothetical protein ACNAN0_08380 [Agrilactobacillus fermenti]|uniref:hypothetical protein n=1 Tax=Agrilactobacillus fermenti TaxID=2586909 RepID=UPI001E3EF40A|nr:hypothetical protein [Agrilactobacillus fermenti]MCD2257261.1 hypothetical protein [Agrilactobacillus fermenti]